MPVCITNNLADLVTVDFLIFVPVPRPQDPHSQLRAAIFSNLTSDFHKMVEYENFAGLGCFYLFIVFWILEQNIMCLLRGPFITLLMFPETVFKGF